ncbi:hypothetical protein Lal_00022952 [Lupinus albus]|nr:hypothetical protein Lal_00022952 [Lupinus albus]
MSLSVFARHLNNAVRRSGIKTFFDEDEIEKGEEINPALEKAIQESWIAVVRLEKEEEEEKELMMKEKPETHFNTTIHDSEKDKINSNVDDKDITQHNTV